MTVVTREQTSRNRIGTSGRWMRKMTNGGIDYKYPMVQWTGILAQRTDMVEVGPDGEPQGALPKDSKKSLVELISNRDALEKEIQFRIANGERDPRATVAEDAEVFLNTSEERREAIEESVAPLAVEPVPEPIEPTQEEGPSDIDRIKAQLKENQIQAEATTVDVIAEVEAEAKYVPEDPELWGVDLYEKEALFKYAQAIGMRMDGRSVRDCKTAINKIKRRKRELWQKRQETKTEE